MYKLKADLDESNIAQESTLAALRQKHNSNMAEMGEQIDSMNKMKTKAEKDKSNMERDLQEARVSLNDAMMERANLERNGKLTQGLIVEANQKLDELARALNDAESSKKKLFVEKQDLERQTEDLENGIKNLGKVKVSLTTQLEDTKKLGDAEARDRAALLNKCKALGTEVRLSFTLGIDMIYFKLKCFNNIQISKRLMLSVGVYILNLVGNTS